MPTTPQIIPKPVIVGFFISQRRKRTIKQSNIIEKIGAGKALSLDDRAAALFC